MAEIKVSELAEKKMADASENAQLLLTEPGIGSYRMPFKDIKSHIEELHIGLYEENRWRTMEDAAIKNRLTALEEGGTGQESGKVKVDAEGVDDYLENLLLTESDSSPMTIQKIGGKLYFGVNLEGESDPKLKTIDESAINANTGNYG